MTAREYIEALARELSKVGKGGLLLSPADAQLALAWHAAQVPLQAVIAQLRRAAKPRGKQARGALDAGVSLQLVAHAIDVRKRPRKAPPRETTLSLQLRSAARAPGLAARAAWEALADAADELLAGEPSGERYWSVAVRALQESLREVPRPLALQAGAALRTRLAPRPRGMPRRRYQRSLQLMLLAAASERLGVPPRAFLL